MTADPRAIAEGLSEPMQDWIGWDIRPLYAGARRMVRNALIRRGLLNMDSPPPIFTPLGLQVRAILQERQP